MESKKQLSVGECVFGKELPPSSLFENHQPHSSFDENGMLKLEAWSANDQLKEISVKAIISKEFNVHDLHNTNEGNIFKIPTVYVSPKLKHQTIKKEDQTHNEIRKNTFNFISELQANGAISNSGEIKADGSIFENLKPTSYFTSNNIFTSPIDNFAIAQNAITSIKEKTTVDNILNNISTTVQSKANHIFGVAAKETANIFQKFNTSSQISDSNNSGDFIFSHISKQPLIAVFDVNTKNHNILGEKLVDKKYKHQQLIYKKIEEDEKKIDELEKNNVKNMEPLQNDLALQLKKQETKRSKIYLYKKCESETSKLISNFVSEEVLKIAQSEILIYQAVVDASSLQSELLLAETVDEYLKDIAHEEYALICYDQLLLSRYFSRWLRSVRKKKEQKKLMDNTPLWITTAFRSQYVQALDHPFRNKNLEMVKRYRLGEPTDFREFLNTGKPVFWEENENPLNLFALIGQHLLTKHQYTPSGLMQQMRYFKFLIALPSDDEECLGFETLMNKWLMKYIQKSKTENGPFLHGLEHNMALCVRKLSGVIPKNECGNKMTTEGDHNDGIIFFLSGVDIRTHSRNRLYNLVKLSKNFKRVPLAIIVYNCKYSEEELLEMLNLNQMHEEGLIFSHIFLGVKKRKKYYSFRNEFIEAVSFIAKESQLLNINEQQALAMQNIQSFLETSLGEEMWQKWINSTKINPVFGKLSTIPKHVVGIYHKALDHLLHITQGDFTDMPEFAEELKEFVPRTIYSNIALGLEHFPTNWKDIVRNNVIKKILQSLFLPEIKEKVPSNTEELKLWLLNYAVKCLKEDDLALIKSVYEAIENLISEINSQSSDDIVISLRLNMINYFNVFKSIIFSHINNTLRHYHKDLMNLVVIYLKDDFKNYVTQPWWLNYQPLNSINLRHTEIRKTSSHYNFSIKKQNENNNCIDSIIEKAESISNSAEKRLLELKQKNIYLKDQNSSDISGRSLQIQRNLDGSFYQFQLSKKIGEYDNTFLTHLTEDIDKSVEEVLNQHPFKKRKRKYFKPKSFNICSEVDEIIAKAENLIKKLDSDEDYKCKIKKLK